MLNIDPELSPEALLSAVQRMWELSAGKIRAIERDAARGGATPVFTVDGKYVAQGWTEWTQGFQFGSAILQFDATDDRESLESGRQNTIAHMATHVTHTGVHDHGFNNISTYGNLRRLMLEGRIEHDQRELELYELAIKASGAVQASRWSATSDGDGYIYSFNGPHSLFSDTIRSCRALAVAHQLGHVLWSENDERVNLLQRVVEHARTTSRYNVYFGEGRDAYDVSGRVVHESIFNTNDGRYRCPSTQQGYSPFTTWTRGLAWIMLGYAELLEYFDTIDGGELGALRAGDDFRAMLVRTARATCDFYINETPTDGVPYWDTGAPGLAKLGDYLNRSADPFNDFEPVDSSAAAIAAQGLLRLGHYLSNQGEADDGQRYWLAGLTTLRTLLGEPYLSVDPDHQGLLLHSIYHQPRGWDHVHRGSKIARGEACMWGDYHLREAALYVERVATGKPYYTFFADGT
ncbi:MAG: glycosyl hydrolase [Pirellulales bacterium]|nr:glycosyl hydrolase [Pirellulales bacterium]